MSYETNRFWGPTNSSETAYEFHRRTEFRPKAAQIPASRYNEKIVALTCYLDAFSGISGDMLVGALADAGADQTAIAAAIASLDAGATVSFERVKRCGIAATKYHVAVEEAHAHRHLSHILEMIDEAEIPPGAPSTTRRPCFSKLGEAEAEVHQVPIEKVHFHEVGAADSIADIVGACVAFDLLGVDAIVCSPLNLGSGTVKTEHGVLPVPAPATARLLHERARVFARTGRGIDHSHRRRRGRHAGLPLRRAAAHETFAHRLWRGRSAISPNTPTCCA